ncbi:MAG: hypothetical protein J6N19_06375 [Clostridium sp.]|nr:hypothetical protein [Clostridium sp.]
MSKKILEINIGDIYGDLECVGKHYRRNSNGSHSTVYQMRCKKCGREKEMLSSTIRYGHGISHKACGKGIKTLDRIFYSRWEAMRTRTQNPNYEHSDCYSEKGIDSDEFEYFIDFYDQMYDSFLKASEKFGKENTSLERLDNSKSYSVENCIWIDKRDQPKNTTRIVDFTVTYPDGHIESHRNINDFALKNGLDSNTIRDCLSGRTKTHKGFRFSRIVA